MASQSVVGDSSIVFISDFLIGCFRKMKVVPEPMPWWLMGFAHADINGVEYMPGKGLFHGEATGVYDCCCGQIGVNTGIKPSK